MSDTPRTDQWETLWDDEATTIWADFARQLERELNATKADLVRAHEALDWRDKRIAELEKDKARLDWLNKNAVEHTYGPQWRIAWEFGQPANIRAAIDAAMKDKP